MMSLLTTSLGSSVVLTLILKASLANGRTCCFLAFEHLFLSLLGGGNLTTWSQLVTELLSCVSEGVKLGDFLVKFTLTESTLDKLVSMDANQKLAWVKIMVRN